MDLPKADRYYLEIKGANSSSDVYMDGKKLATHHGGYSTWRVDITETLGTNSQLEILVDNAANDRVYPQMADFTFYGGLYRNVNIICVSESHFDLDYYGAPSVKVTPIVDGKNANVEVEVFLTNHKAGQYLQYTVIDAEGEAVANVATDEKKSISPSKMSTCGMVARILTFTPWKSIWWKAIRSWIMCLTVSVAVASVLTQNRVLSSMARNIPCVAFPATRTAGALVTHCCPSTTKRIWI